MESISVSNSVHRTATSNPYSTFTHNCTFFQNSCNSTCNSKQNPSICRRRSHTSPEREEIAAKELVIYIMCQSLLLRKEKNTWLFLLLFTNYESILVFSLMLFLDWACVSKVGVPEIYSWTFQQWSVSHFLFIDVKFADFRSDQILCAWAQKRVIAKRWGWTFELLSFNLINLSGCIIVMTVGKRGFKKASILTVCVV